MATATKKRSGKRGKSPDQIYQEVTDRIIEALEQGVVPWKRPWTSAGVAHMNLKTKTEYRGINPFLLDFEASMQGYEHPYWLTYKQAAELGGQVRKGEKSTMVVFWKVLKIDKVVDGKPVKNKDGEIVKSRVPLLRYYNVFNVAQVDGIEDKIPVLEEGAEFDPINEAQALIDNMPKRPKLRHHGDRAFYSPFADAVTLPAQEQFHSPEHYYCTAYHELVHSTGHESRLHRVKNWERFGSDPYAKEELVAEMGAAMLSGIAGIDMPLVDHNAAYIASWSKRFKEDPKLLVQAASKAQQAADFIIDKKFDDQAGAK